MPYINKISVLARIAGINAWTLSHRLDSGKSLFVTMTEPVHKRVVCKKYQQVGETRIVIDPTPYKGMVKIKCKVCGGEIYIKPAYLKTRAYKKCICAIVKKRLKTITANKGKRIPVNRCLSTPWR